MSNHDADPFSADIEIHNDLGHDGSIVMTPGEAGYTQQSFWHRPKAMLAKLHKDFSQIELCNAAQRDTSLKKFVEKYNGLCELICNFIMMTDLLGRNNDDKQLKSFNKDRFNITYVGKNKVQFELHPEDATFEDINTHTLKSPNVLQSHILELASFLQMLLALIFKIFPMNLNSRSKPLYNKDSCIVRRDRLRFALDKIPDGGYIKCEVFKRSFLSFAGHSVLIKKNGDHFHYFDPNSGEDQNLNFNDLKEKIQDCAISHGASDVILMDGQKYMKQIKKNMQETSFFEKLYRKTIALI